MHQEDEWPRRGGGRRGGARFSGPVPGPEYIEEAGHGGHRGGPRHRPAGPPGFMRHQQGWFGGPRGFWMGDEPPRRLRVKRGDVRAAALALLGEEPRNGYQIIQEIGERSDGVWHPSPGSVYPALQQLEDEGLIHAVSMEGGRKGFAVTDEGRAYITEHADEVTAPWEIVAGREHGSIREMRALIGQLAMAAMQVTSAGSETQVAEAQQVLSDTRRRLYRILAADEGEADAGRAEPGSGAAGASE